MSAVDTNLLVYAHRAGCAEHAASRQAIEAAANDSRGRSIPSPSLIETAGAESFPLSPALAHRCLQIARQFGVGGPRIYDLPISLAALEIGVTEIWTHDGGFVALPGLKVLDPLRAA